VKMPAPIYITGPAGTGKTTKLLALTAQCARELSFQPHQKVLAMAYMHGARRRLESSIAGHRECRTVPCTVCTIDSFALTLVNRWRSSLGIKYPVSAAPTRCSLRFERHARIHLTFDEIAAFAADLLTRPVVLRLLSASHPLVVIDEFQDCIGRRLEVIKAISEASQLILAADPFQLLNGGPAECPALDWLESLSGTGLREHHQLTEPHRFSANPGIFRSARAVREQSDSEDSAVPVHFGPPSPIAWWIMERLLLGWYGPCWSGTTALISPSGSGAINDVLRLMSEHAEKRGRKSIRWERQSASDEEQEILYDELGVTSDHLDDGEWERPSKALSARAIEVIDRAYRFVQLRGLGRISNSLITTFADEIVHAARAYNKNSSRFVVTTVHGAKNREFDNVCVIWSYRIPADSEAQRRLLYNAITRAKINCVVFDTRTKRVVSSDPVMSLLGLPKPVFNKKKKRPSTARSRQVVKRPK
jgi:superfamily I DNA/RNA helicase